MRVSIDDGITWVEVFTGVRIDIDLPTDDGEDECMSLNFTHEGLIADLWVGTDFSECLETCSLPHYDLKDSLFGGGNDQ